ncbi:hypothetical protein ES703_39100 [subsurface metagenome]
MNSAQKFAWSNLIIIGLTLTLSGTMTLLLTPQHGIPLIGLLGIVGISSAVFRKRRRRGGINFDERDRLIYERSLTAAHSVFWPFFVAACMLPWLVFRSSGSVPVYLLPMILGGGGVVAIVVQSLAILIQYGWRNKEKSNE